MIEHVTVFRDPNRYAGWPANYGLWAWHDGEIVALFLVGYPCGNEYLHARDKTKPFLPQQARSRDGGRSWALEPFTGKMPGQPALSSDEHVVRELKAGPLIVPERDLAILTQPINFLDKETIVLVARTDQDRGLSWFYTSKDRGLSWQGPYRFKGLSALTLAGRTDIIPLSSHEALFMLSADKTDGKEGRTLCARTQDGGRSFHFESWLGEYEYPNGYEIMPSSVRLANGTVLTATRCSSSNLFPDEHDLQRQAWINLYQSTDQGKSWHYLSRPVANTGYAGNPATLNQLPDGRLVLVYGFRDAPYGLRAVVSSDEGVSWSEPIILRDDGGSADVGYPKTVLTGEGNLVSVYYYLDNRSSERYIAATRFDLTE